MAADKSVGSKSVGIGDAKWAVIVAADAYIRLRDNLYWSSGDHSSPEGKALNRAVKAWRKAVDDWGKN